MHQAFSKSSDLECGYYLFTLHLRAASILFEVSRLIFYVAKRIKFLGIGLFMIQSHNPPMREQSSTPGVEVEIVQTRRRRLGNRGCMQIGASKEDSGTSRVNTLKICDKKTGNHAILTYLLMFAAGMRGSCSLGEVEAVRVSRSSCTVHFVLIFRCFYTGKCN